MSGAARKTLSQLHRQGWSEIPEVMASSILAVIGMGCGYAAIKLYDKKDGDVKRYRLEYTVYRPEDPRVQKIKE